MSEPGAKRTGRPRLADGQGKREVLIVRVSAEEKRTIEGAAGCTGECASAWVRRALLEAAARVRVGVT